MAIAIVASTKGAAATTPGIDTTGADLLVVVQCGSTAPGAPTDSKGNTWTALTSRAGAFNNSRIHYCASPTVGSGHTFTGNTGFYGICVLAVSGAHASPFDVENGTSSASTPASIGSVTPAEDGSLIIAGIGAAGGTTYSIDSGLTIAEALDGVGGVNYGAALAYLIQGTAAAINPAWTWGGGFTAALMDAVFKPAAAAATRRGDLLLLGCGA